MQHKSLNGYDSQSYQKTSGYFRNARGKFSLCHNFTLSVHLYVTPMILSALSEYMSLVYRLVMTCHIWQKTCRVELSSLLRVSVSTFMYKAPPHMHCNLYIYTIYIYIWYVYYTSQRGIRPHKLFPFNFARLVVFFWRKSWPSLRACQNPTEDKVEKALSLLTLKKDSSENPKQVSNIESWWKGSEGGNTEASMGTLLNKTSQYIKRLLLLVLYVVLQLCLPSRLFFELLFVVL